ncbi:TIGR02117 family protein [Aliarcobacter lanthieri]|uniref:TIGR02117 family protein n=1 Tax=Aliarcobacter lanthieri TaxID=1355374 RepID=UPI003AB01F99
MKKIIKSLFYILFGVFLFLFFYILAEYFLSRISQNYELTSNDYMIYIKSNGVHTDIVLPLENNIIKWNEFFPFEDTKSKNKDFEYISIGWGDKGFYLDTPTWSELKVSTALIAGTGLGNAALHITYYKDIIKDDLTYPINISREQYLSIVQSIIASLQYENNKPINIKTTSQYGENDSFYEAIGSYSIFHTCNTWTNKVLKKANLPSAKWVAFDDGILYQYKIALE